MKTHYKKIRIRVDNRLGMTIAVAIALLSVIIATQHYVSVSYATTSSTNVMSSVTVQGYCEIGISNTAVNFGSLVEGASSSTSNLVVANSLGNLNGNIEVLGDAWNGPGTNSFLVGNTLWNPSSAGAGVGNALTGSAADTDIALPIVTGSVVTNNIYFGVTVPAAGEAPGIYTQNVEFKNSCTSSTTVNSIFTVDVLTACFIGLSTNVINFGTLNPGSNTPYTSNLITVSNPGGNVNANILIEGSNWIYLSNSFYVANTVYNIANVPFTSGTAVPSTFTDTDVEILYPPTGGSNSLYFGVAIPIGQASGSYTQNILLENSC